MMVLYDEEEAMRIYIESERYDRKSMGSKVIELQKVGNKRLLFGKNRNIKFLPKRSLYIPAARQQIILQNKRCMCPYYSRKISHRLPAVRKAAGVFLPFHRFPDIRHRS